ncbi:hypothetical protein D1007_27001 [Hordeum vulgare]|nr:hypothetical protein D1007_27001 [Hordeum vulgare]
MADRVGEAVLEHLLSLSADGTQVLGERNGNLIIAITCWFLWWERRKLVHGEHTNGASQIALSVRALAENFAAALDRFQKGKRNPWTRPPPGFTKLNVDASFDPDLLQGTVDAVLRDNAGKLIAASNSIIGVCLDVFMAEALALRFGLNLAMSVGCNKLIVNSDNANVIDSMQEGDNFCDTAAAILDDCYHMARDFTQARHTARIAVGLPPDSPETEEEKKEEQLQEEEEEQPEDMEEEAPGLSMAEAKAEFAIAESKEMTEQQVVLDSIQDEAEVEAKRWLIRQRQTEADALFDELDEEIDAEGAATE